jgi:hypothetical protein
MRHVTAALYQGTILIWLLGALALRGQPLTIADVGNPTVPLAVVEVDAGFDLTASGTDIGGTADQFGFYYRTMSGDFDVRVRVEGLGGADAFAKAGLVAREALTPGSRFAAALATPSVMGTLFESRVATNGAAANAGIFPVNYPNTWLRLKRSGNIFTGYASYDGQLWSRLGGATTNLAADLFVGLALCSHGNTAASASLRDFGDVTGGVIGNPAVNVEPLGPSSRKTGLVITEIMYKPAPRTDGRVLDYVEIFNSNPYFEDISGYRLSGGIDYTFPSNTVMQGGAYLVVAKAPADVEAVYGLSNVLGPYTNNLETSSTVRLRNDSGHIYLEVSYENDPPWPVAADGTGHSLALLRPSYGEALPQAWGISDLVGGSPGRMDSVRGDALRSVVINEFLAHTGEGLDFIELYNHSNQEIDLSGCSLTDDADTNKFVIPPDTKIPARGFVSFDQTQLGFGLNSGGEKIYLWNPDRTRVLDSIAYEAQANGVSSGRSPDGAASIYPLREQTPGGANSAVLIHDIVINEIMYKPISGDNDHEYVELYNQGTNAVDLGGWQFISGIRYTFPANTVLAPGGYLVVAENRNQLLTKYAGALNAAITLGNYDGNLANRGERLALAMPDIASTTNSMGQVSNYVVYVVVDEVTYGNGGNWGSWANEGGSSLELIDPRADHRLAFNWGDSDETAKAPWTTLEFTGPLDQGGDSPNFFEVLALGEGEYLLDNAEVIRNGTNLLTAANSTFESGIGSWLSRGTHIRSSLSTTNGVGGGRCLHIRASARGDSLANRNLCPISPVPSPGQVVTIRAQVRWLRGWPELLIRLHGNYIEAVDALALPSNLGTPGAPNSRARNNGAPAIYQVTHSPVVPAAAEPVVVTGRAHDPDGLSSLLLKYRIDPSTLYTNVAMVDDGTSGDAIAGDGIFSGTIPGQAVNTMVAFYVEAMDGAAPAAQSVFPQGAPQFEGLVRFGDPVVSGGFGTYRQWYTQGAVTSWTSSQRPVLSNERVYGTFVYGNFRAIYNMSGKYSGSPYHQEFTTPVGNCHYSLELPLDDMLLGTENFNKIHAPGNSAFGDETAQREQTCYWLARKMGLPWNYRRFVNMFVNGNRRGGTTSMMEDTETPGNDVVESRFPDDPDGNLYKLQPWFEQDDAATGTTAVKRQSWCTLLKFTSGGQHKKARYRWNYLVRAANTTANDYEPVFSLIDAMSSPNTPQLTYFNGVKEVANIEQWVRTFAVCHAVGDWDHFGTQNSQNMYGYVRSDGRWELMIWDYNIVLGTSGSWGPGENLFLTTPEDTSMANLYSSASTGNLYVRRAYLRSLKELATGPMAAANINPIMQAKYNAMVASGVTPISPTVSVTGWIASARSSILSQVATLDSPSFVLATNSITTNNNLIAITGTAPLELETMLVNGVEYPLLWTSSRNFILRIPLETNNATLVLQGYDWRGNPLANVSNVVTASYTGPIELAEDSVVFSEIMFRPPVTNASYVEFQNKSTNFAFDVSGWRVNGLGFSFSPGTIIPSGQRMLVVKDRGAFYSAFPNISAPVAVFDGNLDLDGETLTLIKPGAVPAEDIVVDRVRYEAAAPWAPGANGGSASLQLIDAQQDNARVSNWSDGTVWKFFSYTNLLAAGSNRFLVYLGAAAEIYIDDLTLVVGTVPEVGVNLIANGDFEGPLLKSEGGPWSFFNPAGISNTVIDTTVKYSGNAGLKLVQTLGGAVAYVYQDVMIPTTNQHTLSFRYRAITNDTVLNARVNALYRGAPSVRGTFSTPGTANSIAAPLPPYPPLWLNEVQPNNVSGIVDGSSTPEPWIELYNAGSNTVSLAGFFLSDTYAANLTRWAFPLEATIAPGEFKIIWADGDPEETTPSALHTSFRLHPSSGTLALTRLLGTEPQIVDYLTYNGVGPNLSYGDYPDGQPFYRTIFYTVTPGATNQAQPGAVFINEWLTSNQNGLIDPADNDRDDWFELYNPNDFPVDLSGYYLSDTLTNKTHSRIPNGYSVPARGFLLVWADNETGQNSSSRPDLHASFDLRRAGEAIALFAPDGTVIDSLTFTNHTTDVSEGRFPDGAPHRYFMTTLTPKTNNIVPGLANTPPVLGPLTGATIDEGRRFAFRATATDFDVPAQALSFSLGAGAPTGANIMPNGEFRWTPDETYGPGTYPITVRVTDNGSPAQSDSRLFNVTVREVNRRPYFSNTQGKYVKAGDTLSFPTGFDADIPANTLAFALGADSPAGVNVDVMTGMLSWTPEDAQAPGAYQVRVQATDDGTPSLSATHTYQVYVFEREDTLVEAQLVLEGVNVRLTWRAAPGANYEVDYRDRVTDAWQTHPAGVVVVGGTASLLDSTAIQQRFYRVRLLPAPSEK